MKKLMAVAVLAAAVLVAGIAQAGHELTFKDGKKLVWSNMTTVGDQLCTDKGYINFCVPAADVKKVRQVADVEEESSTFSIAGSTSGGQKGGETIEQYDSRMAQEKRQRDLERRTQDRRLEREQDNRKAAEARGWGK